MNTFEELQERVLSLPIAERVRLAVAVLDSLDDEPLDDQVAQDWTQEILARSEALDWNRLAKFSRPAQEWFDGDEPKPF